VVLKELKPVLDSTTVIPPLSKSQSGISLAESLAKLKLMESEINKV